jgi:hypothetical protein
VESAVRHRKTIRIVGQSIREQAQRTREATHATLARAEKARRHSQDLRDFYVRAVAENVPSRRRFSVLVRRMYVNENLFQRGEVVTDLDLGRGADLMVARGMVQPVDYDLTELARPGGFESDGRFLD